MREQRSAPSAAANSVSLAMALIVLFASPIAVADDEVVDQKTAMNELRQIIETDEVMALLVSKHPAIRNGFYEVASNAVRDQRTKAEFADALTIFQSRVYGEYFSTYIPGASDDDFDQLNDVFVDILGYLQQRDDNTCYVWITGNRIGHWVPIQEAIPIEDLERQNRVLNNVLASAIRSPVPPSDPALAEQGIYNIFVYLSRVHPPGYLEEMERMLGGTPDANNSQRTCELMYEFFVAMGRIRSAERAAVWKSVFANSISQ